MLCKNRIPSSKPGKIQTPPCIPTSAPAVPTNWRFPSLLHDFSPFFQVFIFFALDKNWEIQGESGLEILPCSSFSFELDTSPLPLTGNKFPGLNGKVWMQHFSYRSLSAHIPEIFILFSSTPFSLFLFFFSIFFPFPPPFFRWKWCLNVVPGSDGGIQGSVMSC